jgi:RND family efflux transporter MFP subunit
MKQVTNSASTNRAATASAELSRRRRVPVVITLAVLVLLASGALALRRAEGHVNNVALNEAPKLVTVAQARASEFIRRRQYVGRVEPWQEAEIGPQLASGYVSSVLVRPGDVVKRGMVLATLDCRNASAASKVVALEARALESSQRAAAREAARIEEMQAGGFVSNNEVDQTIARTAANAAKAQGLMAELQQKQLHVDDCIMRAPFAGEIAQRSMDPGSFVRPGTSLLRLIDRDVVRLVADVPEVDFAAAYPGAEVRIELLATGQSSRARIARRSPAADASTRTIHIELDLHDSARAIPVGTSAVIELDLGEPSPALELPLVAATIRDHQATLFVVRDGRAHKSQVEVLGERGGSVFVSPELGRDALVVTQGRSLLAHGDEVTAKTETWK